MKLIFYFILLFLLLFLLTACGEIRYVPVESGSTEYIDSFHRDSIHLYDSVHVREAGDTVWLEKYRFLYRDRIIRDSIFQNSVVAVPFPVVIEKKVNELKNWQKALMYAGALSVTVLFAAIYYKYRKK